MTRIDKRRLFIGSFIYPAFLGNMTYAAAERLFKYPDFFTCVTTALVLALLLHYLLDWLHTYAADRYLPAQLLWDLLIVVCLYVALRLALQEEGELKDRFWRPLQEPAAWLLATKVLAVMWEAVAASVYRPLAWLTQKHHGLLFDLFFGICYLGITLAAVYGWRGETERNATLALVLLLDALSYHVYAHVKSPA